MVGCKNAMVCLVASGLDQGIEIDSYVSQMFWMAPPIPLQRAKRLMISLTTDGPAGHSMDNLSLGLLGGGLARWIVGYPRVGLGSTFQPLNVQRQAANMGGYTSQHSGGLHFLFVDGSAHFVSNNTSSKVITAYSTRANGEVLHDEAR